MQSASQAGAAGMARPPPLLSSIPQYGSYSPNPIRMPYLQCSRHGEQGKGEGGWAAGGRRAAAADPRGTRHNDPSMQQYLNGTKLYHSPEELVVDDGVAVSKAGQDGRPHPAPPHGVELLLRCRGDAVCVGSVCACV